METKKNSSSIQIDELIERINKANKPDVLTDPDTVTQAEFRVVAALLVDSRTVASTVFLKLKETDFSVGSCFWIFEIANELYSAGKEIDALTVANIIVDRKINIDLFDGDIHTFLLEICSYHTSSVNIEEHIEIVRKASIVRSLNSFAKELMSCPFDVNRFTEQLNGLQSKFESVVAETIRSNLQPIGDVITKFQEKFDKCRKGNAVLGVKSGFITVDDYTGGWQEGDLIILAARPGKGKTAFALNLALNAALQCKDGEFVIFFSLEMGLDQILQRLLSIDSGVRVSLNSARFLTKREQTFIDQSFSFFKTSKIYISDQGDLNVNDIYNHLKKIVSSGKKIKLVILDYLQLVRSVRLFNLMSRQEEVSFISRTLKLIARSLNVPIIACAQLSRRIEERSGKGKEAIPQLSDLRESGAIEQDADLVSFLYNDDVESNDSNSQQQDLNKNPAAVVNCNWLLAKHRNGPTGIVKFQFFRSISKFSLRTGL